LLDSTLYYSISGELFMEEATWLDTMLTREIRAWRGRFCDLWVLILLMGCRCEHEEKIG